MTPRQPASRDPRRLDVAALAAEGGTRVGHWPLAGFERLVDEHPGEAAPVDGDVRWQVRGRRRAVAGDAPQVWLDVDVEATVTRRCQRCLQPVAIPLHVQRSLRFVADEALAADLDADSDDDVLALEPALDLHALVEDELLLALPMVPRHDDCQAPQPAVASTPEPDMAPADEEHPFAALARLRSRPPRH